MRGDLKSAIVAAIVAAGSEGVTTRQLVAMTGGARASIVAAVNRLGHIVANLRPSGAQAVYVARRHTLPERQDAPIIVDATDLDDRIAQLVSESSSAEGLTAAELAPDAGCSARDARNALSRLLRAGRVGAIRQHGHVVRYVGRARTACVVASVGLPMFENGVGERRSECANYSGCLDRFVRDPKGRAASFARCPSGCGSYAAESREEALTMATVQRRTQGEA